MFKQPVTDVAVALAEATAAGTKVVWGPYDGKTLDTAVVQFPGGYVAEIRQGEI